MKFSLIFLYIFIVSYPLALFCLPESCENILENFKFDYFDDISYQTIEKIVSNVTKYKCKNSTTAIQFGQELENFDLLSSQLALELDLNDHNSTINFMNNLNIASLNFDNRYILILKNVKNFSVTEDSEIGIPFMTLDRLVLRDSHFAFYYYQLPLEQTCTLNLDFKFRNIFLSTRITINNFYIHDSVSFPQPICPVPFYNLEIKNLYFYNFTLGRLPEFISSENMWQSMKRVIPMNFPVWNLILINGKIELNSRFLEQKIFYALSSISLLNLELVSIEDIVFRHIQINMLTLKLNNLGDFFSKSDNNWLSYYNYKNKIDFKDCIKITNKIDMDHSLQSLIKLESNYTYPDEHFCSFAKFPHHNLVFPVIKSPVRLKCTCTLIWLLQNYRFEQYLNKDIQTENAIVTDSVQDCVENFDFYNKKCDLKAKLESCGITNLVYSPQCNLEKKYFTRQCWEQFSEIFFILILSLSGTVLGSVTLKVLNDKSFKQSMYLYFRMVIFYQTISFLMLLPNVFIYPNISFESYIGSGVNFCNIDYRSQQPAFRKFKIYISDFFGYFATMNSLFCNLFLTMDRFVFVSNKKHLSWFKIKKKQQIKLLAVSALISLILNLNQLFTCADYDCLKVPKKIKQIFAIGYLIQDGVFILITSISFIVNIFLIIFLRKSLKRKKKILSNVENRSAESDETKALIMVIIQCFLIILSRLPDIFLSVLRIKLSNFWLHSDLIKLNSRIGSLQTINLIVSNLIIFFDIIFSYMLNKKLRGTFYIIFKIQKYKKNNTTIIKNENS